MQSLGLESDAVSELLTKLMVATPATQLQLVSELTPQDEAATETLMRFLERRRQESAVADSVDGKVYQLLLQSDRTVVSDFLQQYFPRGVVSNQSAIGLDYAPLQEALARQNYEQADRISNQKLCEAAGSEATARGWLYFTDIDRIPNPDLKTVDTLWLVYSEGKFGFSVQRKIWLNAGKNWDKLWAQIAWRQNGKFTRYPGEFTWDLTAPRGHLPLSNQIRGKKTLEALFAHPLWTET